MPDYSKLVRKMEWEGDVLHVHDVVKEISDNMEKQMEEVVLNHFDCDFSDFREYMHDKIKWERKQELAMPRWIPVTERLPDVRRFVPYGPIASSKVFFKTSDKTIHLGYLTEFSYVDKHAGKIVLHRWYDDHGDRIENVTKWCELPKEEDHAKEGPDIAD